MEYVINKFGCKIKYKTYELINKPTSLKYFLRRLNPINIIIYKILNYEKKEKIQIKFCDLILFEDIPCNSNIIIYLETDDNYTVSFGHYIQKFGKNTNSIIYDRCHDTLTTKYISSKNFESIKDFYREI